jgi:Transcriptional activator TraM
MDEIKELVLEIAKKHGVSVSPDDPILILQTVNQYLAEKNEKAQKVLLEQYKSEIEEISARWADDNITRAENILNAALIANKNAIDNQIMASMKKATVEIQTIVADANKNISANIYQSRILAFINLVGLLILASAIAIRYIF